MRSNDARVAAMVEVRALVGSVCRSHSELWCWCVMGSGHDGTDIRRRLLITGMYRVTWEIRFVWMRHTRVYIFQKKKKLSRGDPFKRLVDHVKTSCVMCQPYIQHCATAKDISMPWNTPRPPAVKRHELTGTIKKRFHQAIFSLWSERIWTDRHLQTLPIHRENTFFPCLRALGASTLSPRFLFGPQIEWKLNPLCFRQFRFNNARSELHFAG